MQLAAKESTGKFTAEASRRGCHEFIALGTAQLVKDGGQDAFALPGCAVASASLSEQVTP